MLLCGFAEQCVMGVFGRALKVIYVNNGLVGQFSRGEYSPSVFPGAAVDEVAVMAVQVPGRRKHHRTLRLELDYKPHGTTFKTVTVLHQSVGRENRWYQRSGT